MGLLLLLLPGRPATRCNYGLARCDHPSPPSSTQKAVGISFFHRLVALKRADCCGKKERFPLVLYLVLVYLVTALVPSDTACLASSPGSSRRTAVWISRLVMVERLL